MPCIYGELPLTLNTDEQRYRLFRGGLHFFTVQATAEVSRSDLALSERDQERESV